ncbi:MAG: hypothetical protein WBM32_10485, partial [Crocosphaera sp.]
HRYDVFNHMSKSYRIRCEEARIHPASSQPYRIQVFQSLENSNWPDNPMITASFGQRQKSKGRSAKLSRAAKVNICPN